MSESQRLEWSVESRERLDAFLSGHLGVEASRVQVQGWIREGRVEIGGVPSTKPSAKLRPGDRVAISLPAPAPPAGPLEPEDFPLELLYQDEHLLAINKPPGLTVHPGAGQRSGTLVNALLHHSPRALSQVGGEERPGIVHRLDKDTSGVILVARSDRAHRELARQFHDREVQKRYLALCEGFPAARRGVIEARLGRHPRDRKRQAVIPDGRDALTRYEVLETHGRFALIQCEPKTGRTHQIRVHLRHVEAPLLADKTYGRGRPERCTRHDLGLGGPDALLLERHALHAARIEFKHPLSGAPLAFEAALPPDMAATLAALRELAD